jgi:hypothetical protein
MPTSINPFGEVVITRQEFFNCPPPRNEDWKVDETVKFISQDSAGSPAIIGILPNHERIHPASFHYSALMHDSPIKVEAIRESVNAPELTQYDYVISKSGEKGVLIHPSEMERIEKMISSNFHALKELELPDGTTLTIYKRRMA